MLPILLALMGYFTAAPAPQAAPPPATGTVVAELFTSQGCSSCPPADRLLSELLEDADGAEVLALSFHVDYWNYLGWKDPFSDAAFSERQRRYADRLHDRVYTPQLILNGRASVVGSREAQVRRQVALLSKTTLPVSVALTAPTVEGNRLTVDYTVTGAAAKDRLHLALVERHLEVAVRRGENGGRTLRHDNVVRAFETVAAAAGGTHTLTFPAGVDLANAAVIAYVQDTDWQVKGAVQVPVRVAEQP